ncbi:MAG: zinc-binding alcohol dehydrogenase family protein [bacterium]
MHQITLEQPGRFIATNTAPEPESAPGHALVRVRRIGVCGTDLHAFAGEQPFFEYPRVLGHELGVEVITAPTGSGLQAGDRCAVEPYLHCGRCLACRRGRTNCCEQLKVLGVHVDGGMQLHLAVPAEKLHRSEVLAFDQLALVETLGIGAHAVERGAPERGEKVLVVGAGPIGLGVIQFAQAAAANVAVMDLSEARLAFCRGQMGVERTVRVGQAEPAEAVRAAFGGELPTLVLDATGNRQSMMSTFQVTGHGGRIVFVGLCRGEISFDDPNFHQRELTVLASRNATAATLRHVIEQVEVGRVDTGPWITHRMDLMDLPDRFADLLGATGLIKAMINVDA